MRRFIIEVDRQGQITVEHDNFTAAELATMSLIIQRQAMEVLENGTASNLQISGPDDSDGVR
jgi:hypothetical protein